MHPARLAGPALLLLSACATPAWLGAPSGVGMSVESTGERLEQWTYYHGAGRFPGMAEARFEFLQIKFDARGVVHAYNWSGERR